MAILDTLEEMDDRLKRVESSLKKILEKMEEGTSYSRAWAKKDENDSDSKEFEVSPPDLNVLMKSAFVLYIRLEALICCTYLHPTPMPSLSLHWTCCSQRKSYLHHCFLNQRKARSHYWTTTRCRYF